MRKRTSKGACTTTAMDTEDKERKPAAGDSGFALLDHTADVGVKAWGPTPGAAFAAAARGMYAVMFGEHRACPAGSPEEYRIAVSGDTWPDLLVNWLAELLFLFSVDGLVAHSFNFVACQPPECVAMVSGTILGDGAQLEGGEIKAVTYHHIAVDVRLERTSVRVVFDI